MDRIADVPNRQASWILSPPAQRQERQAPASCEQTTPGSPACLHAPDAGLPLVTGYGLTMAARDALAEIGDIALRMRDLAERALDGSLDPQARALLDDQYSDAAGAINRLSNDATFAGINLLDGTAGMVRIQLAAITGDQQTITVDLANDIDATGLGLTTGIGNLTDAAAAMDEIMSALASIDAWLGDLDAEIATMQQALDAHGRTPRGAVISGRA